MSGTIPDMEKERIQSFEQMKVWQEAHRLVLRVFEVTPRIGSDHQEAVAVAMEKVAIEVPRNIAEGFKRRGPRNKAHYYNVAQAALEALRYYCILARDLKHEIDYDELAGRCDQVGRMLDGLVRSMTRGRPYHGGHGRGRRRHERVEEDAGDEMVAEGGDYDPRLPPQDGQ